MTLNPSIINKIILARHLYRIALDNLHSHRDVALFATANLLQDSVEAFLLASSEAVEAAIEPRTPFEQYFAKIDEKIAPHQLPFRAKLLGLNKVRVNAKHYGIKPDRGEVEAYAVACKEFFREACQLLFGLEFESVSLIDLLEDGEVKDLLLQARKLFEEREYLNCLIECRKALYLEFEQSFCIEQFKDNAKAGLLGWYSKAPYYTRDAAWIAENVKDPYDYIQLDHNEIDRELLTNGIDAQVYWNIWRLTPEVYRWKESNEWIWHNELEKTQAAAIDENAAYVLEHSIDIALRLSERRRQLRYRQHGQSHFVVPKPGKVPIYSRADAKSLVAGLVPEGLREMPTTGSTIGLDDTATYWEVFTPTAPFTFGYIRDEDLEWD